MFLPTDRINSYATQGVAGVSDGNVSTKTRWPRLLEMDGH